MVFLGDGAGVGIVFGDGRVFVAQIHLNDLLHVVIQFGEFLFDLLRLSPDAAVDVAGFVIGQVHDAGEILAKADGIKDGEADFARRHGGKEAVDDVVDGRNRIFAGGFGGFEQDGAFVRERQRERNRERARAGQGKTVGFCGTIRELININFEAAEFSGVLELFGRGLFLPTRKVPFGKHLCGFGICLFQ